MQQQKIQTENIRSAAYWLIIRGLLTLIIILGNLFTPKYHVSAETNSNTSYYVSTTGLYANPGTLDAPTTLEGARDKIRTLSPRPTDGITVYLRGGLYELSDSFKLNSQDGGSADGPIVYRSYSGEIARFIGGTSLNPTWFNQVSDTSPVWGRLNQAARGNLWQVDLPAHGITDFGTLIQRGSHQGHPVSGLELAFNGQMMELARWPNRGQTDPLNPSSPAVVSGNLSPDVTGLYDFIGTGGLRGTDDGYPKYQRNGLVNGAQYYLYHCTFGNGGLLKYWIISQHSPLTDPICWPTGTPSWWTYSDQPYPIPSMKPYDPSCSGNPIASTQPIDYSAQGFVRIHQIISDYQFQLPGNRYQLWSQASDILFQGYFYYNWADDTLGGTIDANGIVTLNPAPYFGINNNQPFFVLNLLEELDIPGEWYLDRGTGMLYFWPPSDLNGSEILISRLEEPLLQVNDTSHIYFDNITFESGRADLVNVTSGDDIRFIDCTLRNTGAAGIKIDGTNNSISGCQIYNTGAEGVWIKGGDRPTLSSGNNLVSNNKIYQLRSLGPNLSCGRDFHRSRKYCGA